MYYLSVAVFSLIICFITSLVLSSMSISWAVNPFVIFPHQFPFEIAFGITIPLVIISAILFVLFLFDSTSKIYLPLMIVLILFDVTVPIGLTSPQSLDGWITKWNNSWTNTSFSMSFQLEKMCCGWANYLDRSIDDCPFSSVSGCESMVTNWIRVRYDQIFITEILLLVLYLYSICSFLVAIFYNKVTCVWTEIEIPFLKTNLYG